MTTTPPESFNMKSATRHIDSNRMNRFLWVLLLCGISTCGVFSWRAIQLNQPSSSGRSWKTMVKKPPCEKNSCQDLEYKTLLADKSDFCEPCKELSGMSISYIQKIKKPYKGVCHRLHPPPPQDAAEGTTPGYESPIRIATRRRRIDAGGHD